MPAAARCSRQAGEARPHHRYDVRFPPCRLARSRCRSHRPAAFTVPTGEAHWKPAPRLETGCYVIAAAQAGQREWPVDLQAPILSILGKIVGQLAAMDRVSWWPISTSMLAGARPRAPCERPAQYPLTYGRTLSAQRYFA